MNWAIASAGLVATLVALFGRLYLRIRIRQMTLAAQTEHEFREAALALLQRNIPDEAREHIGELAKAVGTGKLARKLMRSVITGGLASPIRRAEVEGRRKVWADFSRDARIAFTQTVFAGINADSYYAGFVGTALRRTLFYVKNTPAEIAESIDATETRILVVGTFDIVRSMANARQTRDMLLAA
jgi:hypothetical protein